MDDELKHKLAPRRNKRYPRLRDFREACAWAQMLDWQHNDLHFFVLAKALAAQLDDELREKHGKRLDQLVSWEELRRAMRYALGHFTTEHPSIYGFLLTYLRIYLGDKQAASAGFPRHWPDFTQPMRLEPEPKGSRSPFGSGPAQSMA